MLDPYALSARSLPLRGLQRAATSYLAVERLVTFTQNRTLVLQGCSMLSYPNLSS